MNVVIYARYSSYSQTEQSIEGQIKVCTEYAKQHNYKIIDTYIDRATSATTDNRPQFLKMIEDSSKKRFNGILVYQLDRFSRNRYDSATYKNKLKKNNVKVFSAKENISDDASGILMESVLEGMAEYYSKELSQKVIRGMQINANKCLSTGGTIPLGFKIQDKKYVIDNSTCHIVKKIYDMYLNGYTMVEIVNYLNSKNYKTVLGNKFSKNSLRGILSNKKYIGTYTYNGNEVPNGIPAIIDVNSFNEVQEILETNRHSPAHSKAKAEYLLTTKLFCGHCKEMMVGVSGTSKTKQVHYYYMCNGRKEKKCNKTNIKKDYIEDLVIKRTRQILTDDNIKEIANTIFELSKKEQEKNIIKDLEKALRDKEKQKDNLVDSLQYCQTDSAKKTICDKLDKLELECMSIQDEISFEKSQCAQITIPEIVFFLTSIRNGNVNDVKYKKLLINTLINKIYLYDDHLIIIYNAKGTLNEQNIPLIDELESSFLERSGSPVSDIWWLPSTKLSTKKETCFLCGSICIAM